MSAARLAAMVAAVFSMNAHPQTTGSALNHCSQGQFRQFDFWLGSWEVKDRSGAIAGHNTITAEQGGCVVIERWQSAKGGGGMSMNYYEPLAAVWKQNWVSPNVILEMKGGMQGSDMVLEGPLQYLDKQQTTLLRGIWTPLADGRVRQHFVESRDNGKTWNEWFDGYYRRTGK